MKTATKISVTYAGYLLLIIMQGFLLFKSGYPLFIEQHIHNKYAAWLIEQLQFPVAAAIFLATLIKIFKTTFSSIGLKKEKVFRSVLLGLVFAIPFIIINIRASKLPFHSVVAKISSLEILPKLFYFTAFIALIEELFFRGLLHELFKEVRVNGVIKVFILSLLFGISHIPFYIFKHVGVFLIALNVIRTASMHIVFVAVKKLSQNNLSGSIISHALIDVFGNLE